MFAFWLFAIVLAARGTLKLWTGMVPPRIVAWVLLPGSLASELSYYLACLLAGAEFRPGKLLDGNGDKPTSGVAAKSGTPYLTPLLIGLLPLVVCLALILLLSYGFDHPVFRSLYFADIDATRTPPYLGEGTIWTLLIEQVRILRGMCEGLAGTLSDWPWRNWRGWLFEYLMICLVLRMAPSRRPLRPTLIGVAVMAALIAAVVAAGSPGAKWMTDIWPLLSYTWATALLLLCVTLAIRGIVSLVKILVTGR